MEKLNLRDMMGELDTLSRFEVYLENEPLTTDPKPKKARAYVRCSSRAPHECLRYREYGRQRAPVAPDVRASPREIVVALIELVVRGASTPA